MIKLNDSSIYVGQIKQLLKNFNLPSCSVLNDTSTNTAPFYIHNDAFYSADNQFIKPYLYNDFTTNVTTNLRLDNNIYDSYTHRYLGQYLRFLRDYWGLDLMSMYNCCDYTTASFSIPGDESLSAIDFTTNANYTCYAIPLKALQYSVYVDTALGMQYCVGLESADSEESISIIRQTLRNLRVVSKYLLNINLPETTHKNELVLYIKVPLSYRGKIVLLEGNYISGFYSPSSGRDSVLLPWDYNPQLASYQNRDRYLLADKLIQYLSGNVITQLSQYYDIKKLQEFLFRHNITTATPTGSWSNDSLAALRNWIAEHKTDAAVEARLNNYDILGYLDSDVESSLITYYKEDFI